MKLPDGRRTVCAHLKAIKMLARAPATDTGPSNEERIVEHADKALEGAKKMAFGLEKWKKLASGN